MPRSSCVAGLLVEEPLVGGADAGLEVDLGRPAQVVELGDVEHLAGGAVGLGGVEAQRGVGADDVADHLGEVADGDVHAGADVDVFGVAVVLHEEQAGVGEVVDVEELAHR